jgi:cobalt-zinc-cadmium efflux system membrane fusion protein
MNAARRSTWMVPLLLAACLGLRALGTASEEAHHEDAEHDDAAREFTVADFERSGVRLAIAGAGEVDVAVDLPGEVRPNGDRIAHLRPRFPGIVREVRKQTGDRVRTGDVLAVVESENLSPFELRAAFDVAFIVADLSTVWVAIGIYQSALPQIAVGRPVLISASHGALEESGAIAYVSPVVDQATRTASARVVLPNPDGAWRPGLYVTATVYDPWPAPIVIARQALQTVEQRPVVFVVEGEGFAVRPVTVGRVGRSRVEISQGLSPGERFAEERSFLVKAELAKGEAEHEH